MKVSKILVPTDFSSSSEGVLKVATALARSTGASLLITHVEEPPLAYGSGEMFVPEMQTDELKAELERIQPSDPNVPVEHHLLTGDPASAISRLAKSENVDFIVLGTHGRRGISRMLMGSVAEAVVRRSPCPVLTFKQSLEEAEHAAEMFDEE